MANTSDHDPHDHGSHLTPIEARVRALVLMLVLMLVLVSMQYVYVRAVGSLRRAGMCTSSGQERVQKFCSVHWMKHPLELAKEIHTASQAFPSLRQRLGNYTHTQALRLSQECNQDKLVVRVVEPLSDCMAVRSAQGSLLVRSSQLEGHSPH